MEQELDLISKALQESKHECLTLQDRLDRTQIQLKRAIEAQSSVSGLSIQEVEAELSRYKKLYEEAMYLKVKYEEQLNEFEQAQMLLESSDVFNIVRSS